MRDIQPIETDASGFESHPAFGVVRVGRASYGGTVDAGAALYGSDVKHQHVVMFKVMASTRGRSNEHDHHYEREQIVEIEFSESQWASAVSAMNGSQVPCTVRYVTPKGTGQVPGLPYEPRLLQTQDAARNAAKTAFAAIQEATRELAELDPKAGVKARREAMRKLERAVENSTSNVAYATRILTEQTEDTINRARADIEAIAVEAARRAGVESLDAPHLVITTERADG